MKIVHIITGLKDGGAEAVLFRLCKHDHANQHFVVSLTGEGKYGLMLEALGVSVFSMNMQPREPTPLAFIRLVRFLRKVKPDVVQTWMYHSDLFGGLAAWLANIKTVIWGIHATTLEHGKTSITTIWIVKLLAKLSWWLPVGIVACAQRSIEVHEKLGYNRSKMCYIPNGYDLLDFWPGLDPQGELKSTLVSVQCQPLFGSVGRFDPLKDHTNLLDALVILRDLDYQFLCLLVGTGMDSSNSLITESIAKRGLSDYVQLLGRRNDIPHIMNALDFLVLSSSAEAFPNVVCEAMACGTPCVVTDVGDAAYIVNDTGWVVPPKNPRLLASSIMKAFEELYSDSWNLRCNASRRRIADNFSVQQMIKNYHMVWSEAVLVDQ
jgi:glycosyltransferase involved in cell wall biosynthesis